MKKRFLGLLLSLVMIAALVVPALAYEDYGVIYDVTGELGSDLVRTLGEETLPGLSERYGVDLRVDIVRNLEGYEISAYAELFYNQYGYGYGESNDGILLMLYIIEEDDGGIGWGDYYLWGEGEGYTVLEAYGNPICADLEEYLNEEAWQGGLTDDQTACGLALQSYAADLETAMTELGLEGSGSQTSYSPVDDLLTYGDSYVFDQYGALSDSRRKELEAKAAEVSEQYKCGVYIAVVDDFRDFGSRVDYASEVIYTGADLGWGSGRDGILLLLSMDDRDYDICAYGYGNTAFTDYGKETMAEYFLDDFRDNDWYDGFSDYLDTCARYLKLARNGKPVDVGQDPDHIDWGKIIFRVVLIVLIPLVVAGVVVGIFWRQMKSVRLAGTAAEYVAPGGLDVQVKEDVFTHTTVSRVHIQRDSDSGGGGGTSVNSGGFSHSSGKF